VALMEHAVAIAGGGPTGMMLAAELALANVDVAVVERRPDHVLAGTRAGGFHSRTIEVLISVRWSSGSLRRGTWLRS
jgi:2-polyprenyl-6-methoxyphenol hydroxylase-like FAD-dependent oxidoreductase